MAPRTVTGRPTISNTTLSAYTSITLPPFSHIMPGGRSTFDRLLEEQRSRKVGNRRELEYISVTAYSPLHGGVGQRTPAWIVAHLGIGREGQVSEWARLKSGMAVRLFNEGLSEKNHGFKTVWIFGVIGKPYGREPGFHIFWLEPHLFTITWRPIPVRILDTLITIPNHLLPKEYHFSRIHECTLGQRLVHGIPHLQPPLQPWENTWNWKHPEAAKID